MKSSQQNRQGCNLKFHIKLKNKKTLFHQGEGGNNLNAQIHFIGIKNIIIIVLFHFNIMIIFNFNSIIIII